LFLLIHSTFHAPLNSTTSNIPLLTFISIIHQDIQNEEIPKQSKRFLQGQPKREWRWRRRSTTNPTAKRASELGTPDCE
jgi:hypothetical protein